MSKHKHPAISVAATKENFRRAGHVFGTKPVTLALAALSPDAHAAILADAALVKVDTVVHLDHAEAAALPHHDAPHVKQAAAKIDSLPAAVDEDHAKRAATLTDIETDLKRQAVDLEEREAALAAREAQLGERERDLRAGIADIGDKRIELSERLAAFEREKADFEAAKVAASTNAKGAAPAQGTKK